jgi:single-strand DNA-binding protein
MRSVNKVILIGNVTRDPETRQIAGGQSITTFGLATNRDWMSEGQKKSLAEYHNIVAWGRLGELCAELLKKGALVYVEGYLKTRSWEHESGVKVFRTEVVANDMILMEKRKTSKDAPDEQSSQDEKSSQDDMSDNDDSPLDDDFFADMEVDGADLGENGK